jgi:hypothetical protein
MVEIKVGAPVDEEEDSNADKIFLFNLSTLDISEFFVSGSPDPQALADLAARDFLGRTSCQLVVAPPIGFCLVAAIWNPGVVVRVSHLVPG